MVLIKNQVHLKIFKTQLPFIEINILKGEKIVEPTFNEMIFEKTHFLTEKVHVAHEDFVLSDGFLLSLRKVLSTTEKTGVHGCGVLLWDTQSCCQLVEGLA